MIKKIPENKTPEEHTAEDLLIQKLKEINIDEMTPKSAIDKLYEWKKIILNN